MHISSLVKLLWVTTGEIFNSKQIGQPVKNWGILDEWIEVLEVCGKSLENVGLCSDWSDACVVNCDIGECKFQGQGLREDNSLTTGSLHLYVTVSSLLHQAPYQTQLELARLFVNLWHPSDRVCLMPEWGFWLDKQKVHYMRGKSANDPWRTPRSFSRIFSNNMPY